MGIPQSHFLATMKVLLYLNSSTEKCLMFRRDSPIQILGFSDADWATCVDSIRSITRYRFFLGNSLTSWKKNKQNTISQMFQMVVMYCDSQSALHIAVNPVFDK